MAWMKGEGVRKLNRLFRVLTRSDLPIPHLGSLIKAKKPTTVEDETATTGAIEPPSPVEIRPEPTPLPHTTTSQYSQRSLSATDTDPWATSPELRPHESPTNGSRKPSSPIARRTTSSFTTATHQPSSTRGTPAEHPPSGGVGWGEGFSGPGSNDFGSPGLGPGGFGGDSAGGSGGRSRQPTGLDTPFVPRILPTGAEEVITVSSLPEKEGMLFFQHRNYQVTSARRSSKVIRRYSDFVWLLDCLHKRYPFRQLPLLPPKRVSSKWFDQRMLFVLNLRLCSQW
jgi:sorting nexin-8